MEETEQAIAASDAAVRQDIPAQGLTFQKCGVMPTNLVPAERVKRDRFDDRDQGRQLRLMRAVDALNQGFGARTINFRYLGGKIL